MYAHSAMKKRRTYIKPYLFMAIIVGSIFASLLPATVTNAEPPDPASLYIAPEVLTDATASAYRTSMALCLTYNGGNNLSGGYGDTMTAKDAANGNWFVNYDVRPGIVVWNKADDYIGCSTLVKNHDVVKSLGFTDVISMACGVGLVRVDGQDCLNDPKQSDFTAKNIGGDKNRVYAAIDKNRKNASAPPNGGWNDAQTYVALMKTLTDFCQATPVANVGGTKATPTVQAKYSNNAYDIVDGSGAVTKVYYDVPDSGKKAMIMNFADNFHWWEVSCDQIKDQANNRAAAYAAYVKTHPQSANSTDTSSTTNASTPDKTSCAISGIGWIVCPVMRFMAQITDYAYGIVSQMLVTPPVDINTTSPTYHAWSVIRNIANVVFVIGFLIIIYSQVSGVGITNYGIKKILPRIIIAAILVNLSYWICAVAVDMSNILGKSLTGLLESIAGQTQPIEAGQSFSQSGAGGGWDALTMIVITGAAGVAVLYTGLSVLIPMLFAALVAIITVVVVLTARQSLIVLLIVISPLAFVAYLLPNTEKLFHKWRELLQALLLMFPIIAIIFGASKLASSIIMNAPGGSTLTRIMAAGVTIIPLAITPILMKTTTGILGRIGGWINNPNRGPFDRARKAAAGYRTNRQEYRNLKAMTGYRTLAGRGIVARRKAQRQAVLTNRKSELNKATAGYIAGLAQDNAHFHGRLAQGGPQGAEQRSLAQAINTQAQLEIEEVKAATAIIKNANLEGDITNLQKLALGGDAQYRDSVGTMHILKAPAGSALQTAAIQQQFKIGDVPHTDALVMVSGSMGVDQRQAIADGMQSLSGKVKYYGGAAGNEVAQGKINNEAGLNRLVADGIDAGKYSVEDLQNGDHEALTRVANVAADSTAITSDRVRPDGTIDAGHAIAAQKKQALRDTAAEIRTNDNLKKPSQRVQARLDAIEHGAPYVP